MNNLLSLNNFVKGYSPWKQELKYWKFKTNENMLMKRAGKNKAKRKNADDSVRCQEILK